MVVECSYRGKDCKSMDTYWNTVYTRYGKCLIFNNPKEGYPVQQTLKGGIDNGLEVLLDAEQDEYMPVWSDNGMYIIFSTRMDLSTRHGA